MKRLFLLIILLALLVGCSVTSKTNSSTSTSGNNNSTTATTITTTTSNTPAIQLTNPDEMVVNFSGLLVTKADLYDRMVNYNGKSTMLKDVDFIVLKDYFVMVDETELDNEINKLKSNESYYEQLANAGYYRGRTETQYLFDKRVREYQKYNLNLVQKAAAQTRALSELTQEQIETAKANYKVDLCIIPLQFNTFSEYENTLDILSSLTGDELRNKFIELYNTQIEETETNKVQTDEDIFFSRQINCEYKRVEYKELTSVYRDFVYGIEIHNYDAKLVNNNYNIVYKDSEAVNPSNYSDADKEEFNKIIINKLVNEKVTVSYIKDTVIKLRNEAGFKIYDPILANQYKTMDSNFKVSTTNNPQAVYEVNGIVTTADQLYDKLKTTYALEFIMNKINYVALSKVNGIQLSQTEEEDIKEQIAQIKTEFLAQGYPITWDDYMKYYGANSEEELGNLLALDKLIQRYILGYKVNNEIKFSGVYPVLQSEIDNKYNEWFEISASHILFSIDENSSTLEIDTKKAELLAKQVIYGYDSIKDDANGYLSEDEFIMYDHNQDGTLEYFRGLKNISAADYTKVFADLARFYSDDTAPNGVLGSFGPGKMVKEFEDAAKKIAATRYNFPFSDNETIAKTKFGYHVIYVTNVATKPAIPAGYENKTIDEIRSALKTETNNELKAYFDFIVKFEETLQHEHMYEDNIEYYLCQLLVDRGFKFLDNNIQAYYEELLKFKLDLN